MSNEYRDVDHALAYLRRADSIPHRAEGEAALLEEIPRNADRILDLGTGDGRLLALLLSHCPEATGLGLDGSPVLLERARARFRGQQRAGLIERDLEDRLSDLGSFDVVVSSFAIHHVSDERKRSLYGEIHTVLRPGGVFCNLEHVASPTPWLHARFLEALDCRPGEEDPSNRLLDAQTQLVWLREMGFEEVDCLWKWRELALLVGRRPAASGTGP